MVVACVTYMGSAAPPAGTPGGECKIAFDAAADSTAADFLAAALSELNLGRGGDQAPLDPAQLTILYKNASATQLELDERVAQRDVLLHLRGGRGARAAVHQVEQRVRQPQRGGARRQRHGARLQGGAGYLGTFHDDEEAAKAVNAEIKRRGLEHCCRLNPVGPDGRVIPKVAGEKRSLGRVYHRRAPTPPPLQPHSAPPASPAHRRTAPWRGAPS
mgnify:CR=1 FL=1